LLENEREKQRSLEMNFNQLGASASEVKQLRNQVVYLSEELADSQAEVDKLHHVRDDEAK
jgi:uncharacterized protein YigA (DUF484 family)